MPMIVNVSPIRAGGTSPFNGIDQFSDAGRRWIESRTGENLNLETLCALELPWANTNRLYTESSSPELPNRLVVEKYVEMYCSSLHIPVFPVISKSLFTITLDLAYGMPQAIGSASARSCVYAFFSVVTQFGFDDNMHGAMDCGSYASAAQSYMAQITQEMTLDGLQSLIMLIQFQYFLGDLQAATLSVSIATRLLYAFGAHTQSSNSQSYDKSIPECHLRDLFWLCYSFDKDICLRTGQPPSIQDICCDLTLPTGYAQLQDSNILRDTLSIDDHTLPLYPFDLRLSQIKSEAYQALYSASARRKTNTEILSSILKLDEALEQWRLSLHPDFRPTLWFSPETPVSAMNTQTTMLRLAYYHCVTIIHQASERCRFSQEHGPGHDGIRSSISLTINASRSTLSYLQTALPVVKGECFW
ncbi:hypothetical protein SI65_07448 [Aspergillus cristatus]|uniref:Xylanolytic transcriptional activator regulatory domain-containing protein n=1 Tax=Aspergillus cristatus TaxID=573508 RepID=A0A1E3B7Y9_ASPCR|nr:hypothetical protein SI65_07448 [Aspergillus cristatus]